MDKGPLIFALLALGFIVGADHFDKSKKRKGGNPVTPKVTPTTAPYSQEAIASFRQVQIKTAQDMSAHGGSIADIASELKVSQQYVSELLAAKPVAIPKAVTPPVTRATPPARHEVPEYGEEGAIPPPTPPDVAKAGRRRVIVARLKRGEPVPDKLLAEFPDLAAKPPMPAVGVVPELISGGYLPEIAKTAEYVDKVAYRVHIPNWGIPKDATAADIIRFEQEELGNEYDVSDALLKELDNFSAGDVQWVGHTKESVRDYLSEGQTEADISEVTIPSGSRILVGDEEIGFLILPSDAKLGLDPSKYDIAPTLQHLDK